MLSLKFRRVSLALDINRGDEEYCCLPPVTLGLGHKIMDIARLPKTSENNLWYRYNDEDAVLVFVHGMLADTRGCWLHVDKTTQKPICYWPELIESDARFKSIGIYLGGYHTAVDSGDFPIQQCALEVYSYLKTRDFLDRRPVMDKKKITFVCHSMGGVVARYLLCEHRDAFKDKQVGIVLIASPSYGSQLARSLDEVIYLYNHMQGKQLNWGSETLKDLDQRFKNLKESGRIPNLCGVEFFENSFVIRWKWLPCFARTKVVTEESAARYFGYAKQVGGSDHNSICKPKSKADRVHQYLLEFLHDKDLLPAQVPPAARANPIVSAEAPLRDAPDDSQARLRPLFDATAKSPTLRTEPKRGRSDAGRPSASRNEQVARVRLSANRLTSCASFPDDLSVDGFSIAAAGFSGHLYFTYPDGTNIRKIRLGDPIVRCVAPIPEKPYLLTGDDLGRLLRVDTDKSSVEELARCDSSVFSMYLCAKRQILYTAEKNGAVQEWGFDPSNPSGRRLRVVHRHAGPAFSVCHDAQTQTCWSVGADGQLLGTNLESGELTRLALSDATLFALGIRALRVLTGDSKGALRSGKVGANTFELFEGHRDAIRKLDLSLTGRWVCTASKDGTLRLWDLMSKRGWIIAESRDYFYDVVFSPSNSMVLACDGGGDLIVVRLGTPVDDLAPAAIDRWSRSTGISGQ